MPETEPADWKRCLDAAASLGLDAVEAEAVAGQLFTALRDLAAIDRRRLEGIEPMLAFSARWGPLE